MGAIAMLAIVALQNGGTLSGADLSGADLSGANLSGANLSGANLSGANLRWASLRWADLSEATMRDAGLRGADLSRTNLREADLREADLSEANLQNTKGFTLLPVCDMRGHSFAHAVLCSDGWRIRAGCRDFTIFEARKHWGKSYKGDREQGDMYLHAIDWLERQIAEGRVVG